MRKIDRLHRHPQLNDALLAALVSMFTLLESTQPDRRYHHAVVMVPAALLVTLPLAVRRRYPVFVLLFATTVSSLVALVNTLPASAGMFVALLIATYTVFVHCPRGIALRTVPVLLLGATITEWRDPATHSVVEALPTYGTLAAVVMEAVVVRRSREQADRLRSLTAELAASRAEAEQLAVAAERLRIARDMHDVLAHGVSVMTLQAGAARMALHDTAPQVQDLLVGVENLGRAALEELRDILGLLRRPGPGSADELAAPPGDLDRLLTTMRSAGLPLTLEGVDQLEDVPQPVVLTVFRVVQEALTNTLKHAGTVPTIVRLQREPTGVSVEVADRGAPRPRPGVPGGGHGLVGLQERVGAVGGTLAAGPRSGGGWIVRAELPFEPARLEVTASATA